MTTITVNPRNHAEIDRLLKNKERKLRTKQKGVFERQPGKTSKTQTVWTHIKHRGQIRFREGLGGTVSAIIRSNPEAGEWQIVESFVSFLHRNFAEQIGTIVITFH